MADARDLARLALEPDFKLAEAVAGANPVAVAEAIAGYEGSMVPLKRADPTIAERDPRKRSKEVNAISTALMPVGAKLAPHLSPDQASAWADAVMLSLSCWPYASALAAARGLVHEPFKFIGDVDAKAHELAAAHDTRHRQALYRLQLMREEIERAANPPQPQLEQQPQIWTEESIAEANATFRKLGIKTRYRLGADGTCEPYENEGLATHQNGGYTPGSEGKPED